MVSYETHADLEIETLYFSRQPEARCEFSLDISEKSEKPPQPTRPSGGTTNNVV